MQNSYARTKNNNHLKPLNQTNLIGGYKLSHQNNISNGYYQLQSVEVDLNNLNAQQQQLTEQYLLSAKRRSTEQLIRDRYDLLQDFHHINKRLNQIIHHLSLNTNQREPSTKKSSKQSPNKHQSLLQQPSQISLSQSKYLNNPHSTYQNNQHTQSPSKSSSNKKLSKPSIQSSPSNIKNYSKDELQNLNLNEINSLSHNNLKLIISLQQEIQDYQFMLTPQYSEKLNHQIQNDKQLKKQLQQSISSFNKIIHKQNKNYDSQVMGQLEKYSYDKQMQLNLLTKKLNSKLSKLQSIESQSKQKLKKIDMLSKQQSQLCQILQMYQDEDEQGPQQSRRKDEKYLKLSSKKEKIEKMINSMNSNKLKEYNRKLSDFRLLQQQIQEYDQLTKQTDNNILALLNQKQTFHLQHKHIINKAKITPSLQIHDSKLTPIEHSKSSPIHHLINTKQQHPIQQTKKHSILSPKQHSISKTGLPLYHNKLKYSSLHSNSKYQQIGQIQSSDHYQLQNKSSSFQTQQNLILSQPQNVKRRRIYTQLENNHYFTSLERNHHKLKTPQPKKSHQSNISMKFVKNEVPLTKKQRKLNSSASANVGTNGLTKVKIHKSQKKQNEEGGEKNMNDENIIQIEDRIRKLQQVLGKQQVNLGALKKVENRLSLQNSNRKLRLHNHGINGKEKNQTNTSFDEAYESKPFQEPSHRRGYKINVRQRNYKELCQRLGKNKLLIEQDADIRRLIYQGTAGM